jgi:hypothetical protein
VLLTSPSAMAQESAHPSFAADVAKHVIFDPTTYVPALVGYDAMSRDWTSSQPFFARGFIEHNPEFTVSGLPNDRAVSDAAGRQRILADTVLNLEISAMHNIAASAIERLVIDRHPEHRKLVRTVGWIEKNAVAGFLTYRWSASRYRQWQMNERLAQQMGLK